MLALTLTGCGDENAGGDSSGGIATPLPISTMTAADFHAIGVAAGARPLPAGTPLAPALAASEDALDDFLAEACTGSAPLLMPTLYAYASQVPAYEALFDLLAQQCEPSELMLDRLRGRVATSIVSSQRFLDKLARVSSTATFCGDLDDYSIISSVVIGLAARKLRLSDTDEALVEFGVDLLVKDCPYLLSRVAG